MSIHLALPTCRRYGLTTVTWDRGHVTWEPDIHLDEADELHLRTVMQMAVRAKDRQRTNGAPSRLGQPWRLVNGPVCVLAPVPRKASDAA